MLIMIPLTVDEVVAMCQFLRQSRKAGAPFWNIFWKGGSAEGGEEDRRSPGVNSPISQSVPAMLWGVSFPWALIISTMIGLWLMVVPSVFGSSGSAAASNQLVGAMVVTVSVISMAEVLRAGRFLNVLFGLWIIAAPFVLNGAAAGAPWNNMITGLLLILLAFPRGKIKERYGTWDCLIT
jgi:hypothetical protein